MYCMSAKRQLRPRGEERKEDLKRKSDDIKTPKLPEREFEALGTDDPKQKTVSDVISLDDEKMLKELACYHGYVERRDAEKLLLHEGDFLLRLVQFEGAFHGKHLVLSVKGTKKAHHVLVSRSKGQYRIDETIGFGTIDELIKSYSHTTSKPGSAYLRRGIPLDKWEFGHTDLELYKLLGEGAFGELREGVLKRKKNRPVRVAVKLGKDQSEATKEKVREMMKEAWIQNCLKHRNVVRLYGLVALEQPIAIILKLMDGGSLDDYLEMGEGMIDTREKIGMCSGAANGLAYIHGLKIIHRDIAARNCLYNGKERLLKIAVFGLSKLVDESGQYQDTAASKLPIKWLAPESLRWLIFTKMSDVYSFGVLIFEIFTNSNEPWAGLDPRTVKKNVCRGNFLSLPERCPLPIRDYAKKSLFLLDQKRRATMDNVAAFLEDITSDLKSCDGVRAKKKSSTTEELTED